MKVITILLLFVYQTTLIGQGITTDTIWKITDKVSIKAPKNIKRNELYYCGPGCGGYDSTTAVLRYYQPKWEDSLARISVLVIYSSETLDLMKYVQEIEQDSTLSITKQCTLVALELENYHISSDRPGSLDHICSDFSPTKFVKINNKYYYIESKRNELEIFEYSRSVLGIKFNQISRRYQCSWERYLLVDSIIYYFIVSAHEKVKPRNWKKKLEQIKPIFYNLMNSIIIKDDDETIDKEKEK